MGRNKTHPIIKELNGGRKVSCFMLLVFLACISENEQYNTVVAVINIYCKYLSIYCKYLKQNGQLILNILQETIQTIYDEYASEYSNIHSLRKTSI